LESSYSSGLAAVTFKAFLIVVMVTVDVIKVHETEKCHSPKFKSKVLHGLYFFRDNVFWICL